VKSKVIVGFAIPRGFGLWVSSKLGRRGRRECGPSVPRTDL